MVSKSLTQMRKVNELITFAPLREKFNAAIFLLLEVFKLPCITLLLRRRVRPAVNTVATFTETFPCHALEAA